MLRWIGRILSLVVLLALVAMGFLVFLPADRVAQLAAEQLRSLTGRDVTVSGDVSITFWPVLGAKVGALEVGNADWSRQGPMLTARDAAIGLDAAALLSGEIRIRNIEAASPTIRLESRDDGRASWQFTNAGGAAGIETATTPEREARPVSIERLRISDATLVYDAEGQDLVELSGVDLSLDWPEREGPADIYAVLRLADTPVTVSARVGRFATFLTGASEAVDLAVETSQGTVRLDGQAAISGAVAGGLAVNTDDTGAFLSALGLTGADLPAGLGRSLALSADIDLSPERRLVLKGLDADLGAGNRVRGAATVTLDGKPRIDATLSGGALDLTGLLGDTAPVGAGSPGTAAPSGATGATGWSQTPVDASGLAAFDGNIALDADSVKLGALTLGPTRVTVENDRSRMVVTLRDVAAFDGTVSGDFVMNNRDGLSVGGRLNGQGLELQRVLSELAGVTRLSGAAAAQVEFLGAGQSVDAIMRSLRGQGSVSVGRGTIGGIDLDRLMRAGDVGGGTTVFDSLTASFTMQGGNLVNDDLLMLLPGVEARGAGRVGLGARDIDYLVTPKALRVNEGRGLAIPVRIRGPWSSPRVEPDLAAAVEMNFAEERKQAEREIRQKVESRIADELGVKPEEGQSVEDAIQKKIEREIGNRLKSIFD